MDEGKVVCAISLGGERGLLLRPATNEKDNVVDKTEIKVIA
jgi:hypothetical protein